MEAANLSALPFVIRKLSTLEAQRAALEEDRDRLAQQLSQINLPTLFVEGESETTLFRNRMNDWNAGIAVRKLQGTPHTTSELIKRIVAAGGGLGGAPSFFLFDNDVAGRTAYRNLSGGNLTADPTTICNGVHAWCLPLTEEFNHFLEAMNISSERAFFPLEFIYDGELAALCLSELMTAEEMQKSEIRIRQEYHESLTQEQSYHLKSAPAGTKEWLWARGVPNRHKAEFFQKCADAGIPSSLPDLAEKVVDLIN